jgi:large subunit ribosomal protein L5
VSEEKKEKAPKADKPEGAAKAEKSAGKKEGKGKKASGGDLQIAAPGETKISPSARPRLQTIYMEQVVPKLQKEFNYSNAMQVPRLKKVVINCAVKEAVGNPKVLDNVLTEISAITGQKAVMTRARKAIATFKIRKGLAIGVRVTLRRARMYEFLDRFMNVALPRVRDFKGVNPKSFDGRGNYSVGVREQIIFPEINYDKVDKIRGMTISIETTASTNEHARALLTELGMPFRK